MQNIAFSLLLLVGVHSGTICIISSEMHFGWTSPSLPALTDGSYKFRITNSEASWLAVILLAGTVLGAVIAGRLTDILGRKKIILITSVPLWIGWITIGLAKSSTALFVARFVAGISSGLSFSTVPMYLAEIAEPKIRGLVTSLCPVCVVLGVLSINVIGSIFTIDTTAYLASSLPLILFITFIWMPESPSYLLQKSKREKAIKVLNLLREKNEAVEELDRITKSLAESTEEGRLVDLFMDKTNRKAVLIAYGLRTIQQCCGATALTFYCKTIFQESESILSSNVSTIIYFSLQLLVSILAIFLVDIYGRKPLLLVSTIGTTLTLFSMSFYLFMKDHTGIMVSHLKYLPLIALFLNIIFFSVGVRIVPLLMMGEVFSRKIKGKALCVGTIYYSILAMIFAKVFYDTKEAYGLFVPFFGFSVLSFCSIFFVTFLVPETKGLNLEEIQEILKGNVIERTDSKL
ncbi:unnamed protein product [Psylliodes chrysocephalus]|uniref:Major facilitator superfamily (MFS) profile domain-containing protein n=1 Tax=Psylliodes chrysocephalus TaxID=3402493 RepID=A0A9P0D454_9CUCU|nr:unnamed protein product [Psylliodes chrysocephala]